MCYKYSGNIREIKEKKLKVIQDVLCMSIFYEYG